MPHHQKVGIHQTTSDLSMWNMLVLPMSVWVKNHAGLIKRLTGHFLLIIVDDGSSSQTTGIKKISRSIKEMLTFIFYT